MCLRVVYSKLKGKKYVCLLLLPNNENLSDKEICRVIKFNKKLTSNKKRKKAIKNYYKSLIISIFVSF